MRPSVVSVSSDRDPCPGPAQQTGGPAVAAHELRALADRPATRGWFCVDDPPSRRYTPAAAPTTAPSSTSARNHTRGERPRARLVRPGGRAVSEVVNVILSRCIVPNGVPGHPPFGGFVGSP